MSEARLALDDLSKGCHRRVICTAKSASILEVLPANERAAYLADQYLIIAAMSANLLEAFGLSAKFSYLLSDLIGKWN
jgi:hypothetical protein